MKRASAKLTMGSIVLAGLTMIVGCGNKAAQPAASNGALDVTTPTPAATTYTPPTQVASAQPVTYDSMPMASASTGANAGGGASSGPYTVKRGDTLYSIARKSYGDGKQWQKIASANPGLRPESLKVGQTIQIP